MDNIIIDRIIRSKRKTLSLTIDNEARLVVRAPLRLSMREIERFVSSKSSWISQKKSLALDRLEKAGYFSESSTFLLLGRKIVLSFCDCTNSIKYEDGRLKFPLQHKEELNKRLISWYKKQAKEYLSKRLGELSSITGIEYSSFRLSNARRRWGSCSSYNNINLTWRLIMADPKAIDYVIIHELCHIKHKNHSKAFWNMVRELMPNFSNYRRWLFENSFILEIF